jgi:protein-S-isoprenylcysteine O-methyltransferase Ste14
MSSSLPHDRDDSRPGAHHLIRGGERCFPWRIAVGAAGLLIGALVVHPRNLFGEFAVLGGVASLFCVAVGLGLRAWGAACAGGHTRSGKIEAPRLITGGPYAFVRNPIYLGSFVLGLGVVGLLGDPWLLVPHTLVFTVFFGMIVPAEEQFLMRQFGDEYARFRRAVPRLIPRLNRWRGAMELPRQWRAARGELVIGLILVLIYLAFRALSVWRS